MFQQYCIENKIKQEYTIPETHSTLAEQFNGTLIKAARCMLRASRLPKTMWVRAIATAGSVRNVICKERDAALPFQNFHWRCPQRSPLKVSIFYPLRFNGFPILALALQ